MNSDSRQTVILLISFHKRAPNIFLPHSSASAHLKKMCGLRVINADRFFFIKKTLLITKEKYFGMSQQHSVLTERKNHNNSHSLTFRNKLWMSLSIFMYDQFKCNLFNSQEVKTVVLISLNVHSSNICHHFVLAQKQERQLCATCETWAAIKSVTNTLHTSLTFTV